MNHKFLMAVSMITLTGVVAPAFAATGKTGDDRKVFMSQCLKKSG